MKRLAPALVIAIGLITVFIILKIPNANMSSNQIQDFFRTQRDASGFFQHALVEPLEPFRIDVQNSDEACPYLTANATERWRSTIENVKLEDGARAALHTPRQVVRIHLLNAGYYVFVIDRDTHVCVEQVELGTDDFALARRAAYTYSILRGDMNIWVQISNRDDWTYVYASRPDDM